MSSQVDVCVRGSGAVGTSLALALARQGLSVAITARQVAASPTPDVRAYALNAASRKLLTELKVWPALATSAVTPVHDMRVAGDAAGAGIDFSSWQQGVDALAWIVDAAELDTALHAAVRFAPHLHTVPEPVEADLTVWADGKASASVQALGVRIDRQPYGHTALAARLQCERPHGNVAWQWFRAPDVLALLPFDRPEPGHGFGLVWSLPAAQAEAMRQWSDEAFEARLQDVTGGSVGRLRLASPRVAWPLSLAQAHPLCGPGWVLVGDAAHVVHPLAGQGLNLGLADVTSLAAVIAARETWRSVGDEALLRRHARARALPTLAMARVTDGLLHLFANDRPVLRELRNRGMTLLNHLAPIKRLLTAKALDA